VNWVLLGVGALFLAGGVAAYRGWWRAWLGKGAGYTSLGLAWLGIAIMLTSVATPLVEFGTGLAVLLVRGLLLAAIVCFVVGALSPFWMWWRLLPQWVRTLVTAHRRLEVPSTTGRSR
jgi:hypothetical protein